MATRNAVNPLDLAPACGYGRVMADEDDEQHELPRSFGWTSSRATHMYYVHHAPLEELLSYLGLEPLPDAPPPDLGETV